SDGSDARVAALIGTRLSLLGLSAIIYYSVSGGPYGAEDAVSSAGPLLSLAGFLVMPLVWSLPEALITAELATTFPSNAGFVEWVTAAFGPFWGFQEGFLSWISSVADAALYPVLFRQYLVQLWPNMSGGISGQIFVAAVTPLDPDDADRLGLFMSSVVSEVAWSDFLNCLFWNLNYWDTASTLAGEVQDVSTTYPKALGVAMVAVVLSYFLPLLVGLGISGATSDWRNWQDGEFALMGRRSWVITGAAVSCLGQQLSEMAEAAFQLQGLRGWRSERCARGTVQGAWSEMMLRLSGSFQDGPTRRLVLSVFSSFNAIINMLNSVYCVAQVIEFSAFLHLRRDWFQVASLLGSILSRAQQGRSGEPGCLVGQANLSQFHRLGLLLYHLLELSRRSLAGESVTSHEQKSGGWDPQPPFEKAFGGGGPILKIGRGWLTFYRCPPGGLEDILAQRPNESLWALGPKVESLVDDANDTQALPLSWRAELSQSLGRL
ncbi:unnamed protein product, partial [Durusdinium trenchii]